MSKAHDCLVMANEQQITIVSNLKRILRMVANDDVTINFSDGSQLIYHYTSSWRTDTLTVNNGKQHESL